jgi:hypothetical protein
MTPRRDDPRWHQLTQTARRLRAGTDRDVPLTDIAAERCWTYALTQQLATEMTELRMMDMGLGHPPTLVEAP